MKRCVRSHGHGWHFWKVRLSRKPSGWKKPVAPVSSPSLRLKVGSLCVLVDLCGGTHPHGPASAEETQHKVITGHTLKHIQKCLTVSSIFFLFLLLSPPIYKEQVL